MRAEKQTFFPSPFRLFRVGSVAYMSSSSSGRERLDRPDVPRVLLTLRSIASEREKPIKPLRSAFSPSPPLKGEDNEGSSVDSGIFSSNERDWAAAVVATWEVDLAKRVLWTKGLLLTVGPGICATSVSPEFANELTRDASLNGVAILETEAEFEDIFWESGAESIGVELEVGKNGDACGFWLWFWFWDGKGLEGFDFGCFIIERGEGTLENLTWRGLWMPSNDFRDCKVELLLVVFLCLGFLKPVRLKGLLWMDKSSCCESLKDSLAGLGTVGWSVTDRWGTNGCLALIVDQSQEQVGHVPMICSCNRLIVLVIVNLP